MQRLTIGGAHLEVSDTGAGEPVVMIQTALTADELLPVSNDPALAGHRRILYHRPGYGGSSPPRPGASIVRDAEDCRALLAVLGVERAHIVGVSYSGAVAIQLAVDAPGTVHTLTVIEPPPMHTRSADDFRAASTRLVEIRERAGPLAALEAFLGELVGPGWRQTMEAALPGSVAQMEHDAATFFDADIPALLGWADVRARARTIAAPVLYVGGTESGPWFRDVRDLALEWWPDAEEASIVGADHSLALTHAPEVARHLAAFFARHPLA